MSLSVVQEFTSVFERLKQTSSEIEDFIEMEATTPSQLVYCLHPLCSGNQSHLLRNIKDVIVDFRSLFDLANNNLVNIPVKYSEVVNPLIVELENAIQHLEDVAVAKATVSRWDNEAHSAVSSFTSKLWKLVSACLK